MGKPIAPLFIISFLLMSGWAFGQNDVVISHPVVEKEGQQLQISYHIINSHPGDLFNVTLLITDTRGVELEAATVSGDVGHHISGGTDKHITWNAEADSVSIEDALEVKLILEVVSIASAGIAREDSVLNEIERAELLRGGDPGSKGEFTESTAKAEKPIAYKRSGLVFQSLLFPGWGLTRLKQKPHWIKGLASYACVGGAVYLNRRAVETYAQIDGINDYPGKDNLYQKSLRQDQISEVLAYTAIGIWVADFVWTLVGTSELGVKHNKSPMSGLSLKTNIDPLTYAPMVGIHYRF